MATKPRISSKDRSLLYMFTAMMVAAMRLLFCDMLVIVLMILKLSKAIVIAVRGSDSSGENVRMHGLYQASTQFCIKAFFKQ